MGAATKARSIEANDPSVLFLIARIFMDQQNWSHGAETLTEILRDHPRSAGHP
jgi:cytochrome c-type biogenesis protein CcmH/NrfG